jgi:hypothetical protein
VSLADPYADFLTRKSVAIPPAGLTKVPTLHPALFEFQRAIVRRHLQLGRGAIFAGTGLGKTLMQLAWADAVERSAGGPVLVLTPLAVAQQTVREAERFGFAGCRYARVPGDGRIVVTNYDRADRFDPDKFAAVVLDESSILKAHDSQTRIGLTEAFARCGFKLPCTATPAPNDWTELGNHAEFLGVATAKEMLSTYFVHDGSIRAGDGGADGWRLKRHAQAAFWAWVASWSTMLRHPRDLGFEQDGYDLPPLVKHQVSVPVDYSQVTSGLFPMAARTLGERQKARRDSIGERVAAAAAIANAAPDRPWLIWCGLNLEAEALVKAIPGAVEVRGPDDPNLKASRMLGFCEGRPRVLVTKPSIAGFGMNWQHCSDMVFVGLNDSFEQLFQAIRRCWRFGQTQPVHVHLVASELEGAVVANLEAKERDHEAMAEAMAVHMRDLNRQALVGGGRKQARRATQIMEVPAWLTAA